MRTVDPRRVLAPIVPGIFILVLFSAAFRPSLAIATSVLRFSDQDLVRYSSTVVEARVTNVQSDWNASRTQIHTLVTLRASSAIKGDLPANGQIVLRLLGGQVGDTVMQMIDQPTFVVDEDVILFLNASGSELMPVTGLSQGKFTLIDDPATGLQTVAGRGITRAAFVRSLSRIVVEQEGGR